MSHHIIEVEGLEYTYPDGTEALRGVSLRITHGESVGIVGANGAGKSTLLLHLNGCLKPTAGRVQVGGYPMTRQTLPAVRRTVGMIFQNPDDQLFMPSVYDDVAFGPLNLGLPPEEVDKRVKQSLATVGSLDLIQRPPYKLSGGEKRAVAIATVLSMSPDILVMDEPSSGLDPRTRRQLLELLKTFEHTRIVATHDLDFVLELCCRVIVMSRGRIVADGPTLEILGNERLMVDSQLERPLRMQGWPA